MFYWKVTHKYRLIGRMESKGIGIYSSREKAQEAVERLKTKEGFKDTPEGFKVNKVFRFMKPRLLDNTYWVDGYDTYFDVENKKIVCDKTLSLMKHFAFLIKDYGFHYDKAELGDLRDANGKIWFYGPFNCYYFYKDGICINFMNLVQRQDWDITITKEVSNDQTYLNGGQKIDGKYCYNWELLSTKIKEDLENNSEIFGNKI